MTIIQAISDPATLVVVTTVLMSVLGVQMAYEAGRLQGRRDEERKWLSFRCESCLYKDIRAFLAESEQTPLPFWVRWLARFRDR